MPVRTEEGGRGQAGRTVGEGCTRKMSYLVASLRGDLHHGGPRVGVHRQRVVGLRQGTGWSDDPVEMMTP